MFKEICRENWNDYEEHQQKKMERMIVDWSGLNQAAKISREKNTKNICITRSIKVFYSFKGVSGRQR